MGEMEMALGGYTKKRILYYKNLGLKPLSIVRELEHGIQCRRVNREGVRLFLSGMRRWAALRESQVQGDQRK